MSRADAPYSLSNISAIILAGGLGSRLRAVLPNVQKVAAPVAGHPFAAHLLRQLASQGIRHVILALGHHAESTADALEPIARALGLTLELSVEPSPLGTGGAIRLAARLSRSDPTLVMNGDSLVEVDLAAVLNRFSDTGAQGLVTLARVDNTARYGRVELDASGRVTAFKEKGIPGPGLINAGVYLLSSELIVTLPENQPSSLEHGLLSRVDGLWAAPTDGKFIDIGTPETLALADDFTRDIFTDDEGDFALREHIARLALVLERAPEAAEPHHPPNQEALFGPGRQDSRLRGMMEDMVACATISSTNPAARRAVADAALCLGLLDDAMERYRALFQEGLADATDLRRLGLALFATDQLQDATDTLETATRSIGSDCLAWRHLGGVFFALGRLDQAITSYRMASTLAPWEPEPWRNLARCHRARGEDSKAVGAYHRVIALAPGRAEAYRNLGHIQYYAGDFEPAAAGYEKARAIDPVSPLAHFSLGCVAFALGDAAQAAQAFTTAERLDPEHYPTFGLALVETYRLGGDSVPDDLLDACRRRLTRHFRETQARHHGVTIDEALVRCLWPARFLDFFQAQSVPVEEHPAPAPPPRPMNAPWHVTDSVARAEANLVPLRLVRQCQASVSLAEHCSSASLMSGDAYLGEMVYERPATGPHGEAFYFPPNKPLGFPVWARDTNVPTTDIDEPVVVIGGSFNYGHFLLDTLGKLMVAERFGDTTRPVYTFPLHRDFGIIARTLFPNRRFHDMAESGGQNALFNFADAEVPGRAPYHMIIPELSRLAERAGLYDHDDGPERVYLSRRHYRPLRHRVDNDEEVSAFLEARGFTVLFPEQLDFKETVRVFRSARVIVAAIGAQYGNVVFSRPGARYIELTPTFHRPNPSNQHYDCISHYAGVEFIRLWGEDVFLNPTDPTLWASRFDVEEIAGVIGPPLSSLAL